MTLISNFQFQTAIVSLLKSFSSVTALVTGTHGIDLREDQWQGNDFGYPNIRVQHVELNPDLACTIYKYKSSILINSEVPSSQEADTIAGVVGSVLDKKQPTVNNIRFTSMHVTDLVPASREGQIWRAEVTIEGLCHVP